MKHLAFHHPSGTPHGAFGRRASRIQWRTRMAAAAAAALARRFPFTPSHGADPHSAGAPARPETLTCRPAASLAAAPAATAATRWERQGTRAVRWVEGLAIVLLMAYFGGGMAAILGGY